MRLAARRLPKCSTACNQSSADRFRRSRIGGAFFGITPRFPGFNWRPVQSSNGRHSHWHVAQGSPAAKVLSGRKGPTLTTIRDYTPELSKPNHPNQFTPTQRLYAEGNFCRFCTRRLGTWQVVSTLCLAFLHITVIMRHLRGDVFSMTVEHRPDFEQTVYQMLHRLAVGTSFHPNENDQTRCPQVLKTPRR